MSAFDNKTTGIVNHKIEYNRDYFLIDLFVDMCFTDIKNPALVFQFKILATNLGYSAEQIKKVVEIGKSEYVFLLEIVPPHIYNAKMP
ncbi:MAG: hypothetical protein ACI85Q_001226 [Salibacteraceae bacterium]|jgi:hypothetical protein